MITSACIYLQSISENNFNNREIMHYILFYKYVQDYLEKRGQYREEHLKLANISYNNGKLIMAGVFTDPADGAALIFKGDSPVDAENFAKNDIYVKSGLVLEWSVRAWAVCIGG